MKDTLTAGTANVQTDVKVAFNGTEWRHMPDKERNAARDLFDVLVYSADEMVMVPRNELAKSLLHQWLGGDCQRAATLEGMPGPSDWRYGRQLRHLTFKFTTRPMLASGDDPYFTGMQLTDDEHKAARDFIAHRRRQEAAAGRRIAKRGKKTK